MDLTDENKAAIDALDYLQLLYAWRLAPIGDPRFQGETGKYWGERMKQLRSAPGGSERHVSASKSIGWG